MDQLYDLLALRQQVFVMEQACVFLDADGLDRAALHLMGHDGTVLAAYARILPARVKYWQTSIGRVAVAPSRRLRGLGRAVMREAISRVAEAGGLPVRIAAQARLADGFYAGLGFRRVGAEYDEDGIAHIDMLLDEPAGMPHQS